MRVSPSVVRIWMPGLMTAGLCLFLYGQSLWAWLVGAPVFFLAAFMASLAQVRDDGSRVWIRRLWGTRSVPAKDVLARGRSFLDDIDVLRLRQPVFPWGRVYFVAQWTEATNIEPNRGGIDAIA
jgi:hypothetical protein